MKILMVTESFPPICAGSGWSTYYLAQALTERGHTVTVAQTYGRAPVEEYEGISIYNASLKVQKTIGNEDGSIRRELLDPYRLRKLVKKLIKENQYDLLHAQHRVSTLASVDQGKPVIVTLRDYWPLCYKGTLYKRHSLQQCTGASLRDCFKCMSKENKGLVKIGSPLLIHYALQRTKKALSVLKKVDRIIAVSDFVKQTIEPFVGTDKVITIHNIIDLEKLKQITPKKLPKKSIVFAGKLNVYKGVDLLGNAARHLLGYHFIFIGGGSHQKELEGTLAASGVSYEFIPPSSNEVVLSTIKGAYAFVAPARWNEPFGRTIVEALGVGACIITTSTGGTPEIIQDGKNGLLFDGTVTGLVNSFKRLEDKKLRDQLKTHAQKSAEQVDKKTLLPLFEKVYAQLLDV